MNTNYATLLRRLLAEAETEITQHKHDPQADEWYSGRVLGALGGGDRGPFNSPEDALIDLVRNLWERYDEVRAERDRAERTLQHLISELGQTSRSFESIATEIEAESDTGQAKGLRRGASFMRSLIAESEVMQ